MKSHFATLVGGLISLVAALGVPTTGKAEGWKPAGSLIVDVQSGNAFALSDGRVVSVGMRGNPDAWHATTQFWDSKTKTWAASKIKPALPRLQMGVAVMLDDGRILVTGFCKKDCGAGSNAELYDPATDSWTIPGQMAHGRYFHSMVKLLDGRVLVLGGCTSNACMSGTLDVEVFDPKAETFAKSVAPMTTHRVCFTATLLDDGRVLAAGGYNPSGVLRDSETFDPVTSKWTVTQPMKHPHVVHAAARLQDGSVLVVGGDCEVALPCADADLFNPMTGKWKSLSPMSVPRSGLAAVLLQDGRVLISGGLSYFGTLWQYLPTCEAYDPIKRKFVEEEPMAAQRANFSLARLPNGKVLAVGGDQWAEGENKIPGTAELYTP
jgi:hypothetical protein